MHRVLSTLLDQFFLVSLYQVTNKISHSLCYSSYPRSDPPTMLQPFKNWSRLSPPGRFDWSRLRLGFLPETYPSSSNLRPIHICGMPSKPTYYHLCKLSIRRKHWKSLSPSVASGLVKRSLPSTSPIDLSTPSPRNTPLDCTGSGRLASWMLKSESIRWRSCTKREIRPVLRCYSSASDDSMWKRSSRPSRRSRCRDYQTSVA